MRKYIITYIPYITCALVQVQQKKGNVNLFLFFCRLRIRIRIDLRNCMKINLDPDHYSDELDPNPHNVKVQEFLF
jgi:hypothetical protein